MKEEKSQPNPDWVDAPFEAGIVVFNGKEWVSKTVHSLDEMDNEFRKSYENFKLKPNERIP